MITFFVLLILYCGLFPFLGFHIVQRRIKGIGRIRTVIRTRYAVHAIANEMESWLHRDDKLILDVLKGNIEKRMIQSIYWRYYGKNIMDVFRDELNGESFNKAWKLVNQQ